jgi:hypothetical protein
MVPQSALQSASTDGRGSGATAPGQGGMEAHGGAWQKAVFLLAQCWGVVSMVACWAIAIRVRYCLTLRAVESA